MSVERDRNVERPRPEKITTKEALQPLTAADRACYVPWSWWRTAHNDIGGPDRD